ncbi:hypothetical protein [Sulfurimonas paralvinellae]|uniref:Integrase n=1 Tax=Sulfurimonas paralvinellae TaxID=317658 RepID=A0A7M1B7N0_9BACT|nr:hypothetical protein [Sulfurimonas paralvinellae]QOP45691.1 hypothetical protein FM071_05090 [Sulfurimonas paralvinellae]
MANLKGSTFEKQVRDANFRLAGFKEKRNGTNSNRTHSDATRIKRDSYFKDFKEFAEEQELDGKLNELMTEENMSMFLEQRLQSISSFSAQEDYIRGWSGLVQGLQQSNVSIDLDRGIFNEIVAIYKEDAIERGDTFGEPKPITTSFHPTDVINELNSPLSVIAQVQYETGFRVSEAYTVINDLEKHLDNLKLHSVKGKGGQMYNAKIISLELKLMLLKLKAQNVKIPHQSTYYRHLQKYDMASHDIRAFYTKELYEEKREEGLSHIEACQFVSKEINHHRIQITEYYLAKFS